MEDDTEGGEEPGTDKEIPGGAEEGEIKVFCQFSVNVGMIQPEDDKFQGLGMLRLPPLQEQTKSEEANLMGRRRR